MVAALVVSATLIIADLEARWQGWRNGNYDSAGHYWTMTPIKHIVIIFQENESFDHYFETYPKAINPPGETDFYPRPNTPSVNGLNNALLNHNPNGPTAAPFA